MLQNAQLRLVAVDACGGLLQAEPRFANWPRKFAVLGVDVSATTYAEVTATLIAAAKQRVRALVDFMPVDLMVQAAENDQFRSKLNAFELVCPDGQPVRWCLSYFHATGLPDRVCGTATMLRLCEAAVQNQVSIYLYGS